MVRNVSTIRRALADKFAGEAFTINDTGSLAGSKTIELVGVSFRANEPAIFGEPNHDYIAREIKWYQSQSLRVDEIPGKTPKIWEAIASEEGLINSNYGYLVLSDENGNQLDKVIATLSKNPSSRQAVMIYTRPFIHDQATKNGMSDFICTNTVQYLIRGDKLDVVVQMRSNDAWAGYRNDYAWQKYMQTIVIGRYLSATGKIVEPGDIIWQVGSLHIYEAQFYLLRHFNETGKHHILKKEFTENHRLAEGVVTNSSLNSCRG